MRRVACDLVRFAFVASIVFACVAFGARVEYDDEDY